MKTKVDDAPTVDDYFNAAHRLAKLVRDAFRAPGTVKRPDLLVALEEFERVDYGAM